MQRVSGQPMVDTLDDTGGAHWVGDQRVYQYGWMGE